MLIVPPGSTRPHLDPALAKRWRSAVHALGAEVVSAFDEPTVGRNFHRVTVRIGAGGPTVLLLNAVLPLVAASAPFEVQPSFLVVPAPGVFVRYGFPTASPADLNEPVTEALISTLSPDERRDVAYHQPRHIGDLLFNWFD